MKTSLLFGTAFATLGMAVASMFAQTQTATSSSSSGYIQTSKIVGTKVKTSQGEDIGVVKDVVLDSNTGCMAYTVLSAGGTGTRVTGQAKTVAVPWGVYTPSADMSVLTVRVDRDRIYNAPVFDYARINEYQTTGYINNVYSYYGVTPQAGIGVSGGTTGTTTTGTTTTGATGAATGAASPMATASPGPDRLQPPALQKSPLRLTQREAEPEATRHRPHRRVMRRHPRTRLEQVQRKPQLAQASGRDLRATIGANPGPKPSQAKHRNHLKNKSNEGSLKGFKFSKIAKPQEH